MKTCGFANCNPCKCADYEFADRAFLYNCLRHYPDSALIDVGAHVGLYGYSIRKMMAGDNCRCRVVSIEPDNRTYPALIANVGEPNTFQVAAWDKEADLWFTTNGKPHGHILLEHVSDCDCVKVKGIPLDSIFGLVPEAIAIKIDTEGTEYRVLKGARGLLQEAKSVAMVIEMSQNHLKSYDNTPEDILTFCDELQLTPLDKQQLVDVANGFKRNVLFVKGYTP